MGTNNTEALKRIQNHIKKVVGQEVDFGFDPTKAHINLDRGKMLLDRATYLVNKMESSKGYQLGAEKLEQYQTQYDHYNSISNDGLAEYYLDTSPSSPLITFNFDKRISSVHQSSGAQSSHSTLNCSSRASKSQDVAHANKDLLNSGADVGMIKSRSGKFLRRPSLNRTKAPPSGLFLTGLDLGSDSKIRSRNQSQLVSVEVRKVKKFREYAKTIALCMYFTKFLSRILKNSIEWGYEYDFGYNTPLKDKNLKNSEFQFKFLSGPENLKQFDRQLVPEVRELLVIPEKLKTEAQIVCIQRYLRNTKAMKKYPLETQKMLIKKSRYEKWEMNRLLFKEGHDSWYFYILLKGCVELTLIDQEFMKDHLTTAGDGDPAAQNLSAKQYERASETLFATVIAGESFGENENLKRSMSAKSTTNVEVLMIEKREYDSIIAQSIKKGDQLMKEKLSLLYKEIPLMTTMKIDENAFVRSLEFRSFPPNTPIIYEGRMGSTIWFVRSGTCRILKLVKFKKAFLLNNSYSNLISTKQTQPDETIKLLCIGKLTPGSNFGSYSFFESSHTRKESFSEDAYAEKTSSSINQISVVSCDRVELVGMSRFDFRKMATSKTWEVYLTERRQNSFSMDDLYEEFKIETKWRGWKEKTLESIRKSKTRKL